MAGTARGGEEIGCFDSGIELLLKSKLLISDDMTKADCAQRCGSYGFNHAGVLYKQCACSNQWTDKDAALYIRAQSACNQPCPGDSSQVCGSSSSYSVVFTGVDDIYFAGDEMENLLVHLEPPSATNIFIDAHGREAVNGGPVGEWRNSKVFKDEPDFPKLHAQRSPLEAAPRFMAHDRAVRFEPGPCSAGVCQGSGLTITTGTGVDDSVPGVAVGEEVCTGRVSYFAVVRVVGAGTHDLLRAKDLLGNDLWSTTIGDRTVSSSKVGGATASKGGLIFDSPVPLIVSVVWDGTTLKQYINGAQAATATASSSPVCAKTLNILTKATVSPPATTTGLSLYEVLVFNTGLPSYDRHTIELYLARKHGVDISNFYSLQYKLTIASNAKLSLTGPRATPGMVPTAQGSVKYRNKGPQGAITTNRDSYEMGVNSFIKFERGKPCPVLTNEYHFSFWYQTPPASNSDNQWRCALCDEENVLGRTAVADRLRIMPSASHWYFGSHNIADLDQSSPNWHYVQGSLRKGRQDFLFMRDDGKALWRTTYQTNVFTNVSRLFRAMGSVTALELRTGALPMRMLWDRAYAECGPESALSTLAAPSFSNRLPSTVQQDRSYRRVEITVKMSLPPQLSGSNYHIHFTRDGTDPTCGSEFYQAPLTLRGVGKFTIKARTCVCIFNSRTQFSPITSHTWTLQPAQDIAFLIFDPDGTANQYERATRRLYPNGPFELHWTSFVPAKSVRIDLLPAQWQVPRVLGSHGTLPPRGTLPNPLPAIVAAVPNTGTFQIPVPSMPSAKGQGYRARVSTEDGVFFGISEPFFIPRETNYALAPGVAASAAGERQDLDYTYAAKYANDGHYRGRTLETLWFSYHPLGNNEAWWKVDLLTSMFHVGTVRIINYDEPRCDHRWRRGSCSNAGDSMKRLTVKVSEDERAWQICSNGTITPDWQALRGVLHVTCGLHGRFVQVSQVTRLDLIEVEVFMQGDPVCGDGKREGSEECDDGNFWSLDGCDGVCKVEAGWNCAAGTKGPDVCTAVICEQNCPLNGVCEDGGPLSTASYCVYGHDCGDCNPRCAGINLSPSWLPGSYHKVTAWDSKVSGSAGLRWAGALNLVNGLYGSPYIAPFPTAWHLQLPGNPTNFHSFYLRLGQGKLHPQGTQPFSLHDGYSITIARLWWYKHASKAAKVKIFTRNSRWQSIGRQEVDFANTPLVSTTDGLWEFGQGWHESVTGLEFHAWGQVSVRQLQVFGTPIPEWYVRGTPNRFFEPHALAVVRRGGSFTFLNTASQHSSNCLFRGNKAYVRRCMGSSANANAACGTAYPWQSYTFPNQNFFNVPGLLKEVKFRFRLAAMYHPNAEALHMDEVHVTGGASLPGKPLGLNMAWRTGGAIHLRWHAPNDTGGVPLTAYRVQVGLPAASWTRFDAVNLPQTVMTAFGKTPGVTQPTVEQRAADGTIWEYMIAGETLNHQFTVAGLRHSMSYRFRVTSLNFLSTCVMNQLHLSSSPHIQHSTTAQTRPMPPILSTSGVTGGSVSFNLEQPDDTGGFPLLGYDVKIMVQPWLLSLYLKENDKADECAASQSPCDPQQECINTIQSYKCGPCNDDNYLNDAGRCISLATQPVAFYQDFELRFGTTHIPVSGTRFTPATRVRCDLERVQSFTSRTINEDFWETGAHGWTGSSGIKVHVQKFPPPVGVVLGGPGAFSLSNHLTKIFNLGEHTKVEILFSIVQFDHRGRDHGWRVFVDGNMERNPHRKAAGAAAYDGAGSMDWIDSIRPVHIVLPAHISPTLNLTVDMNDPYTAYNFHNFAPTSALDSDAYAWSRDRRSYYNSNHDYWGLHNLTITIHNVPTAFTTHRSDATVTTAGFSCKLPPSMLDNTIRPRFVRLVPKLLSFTGVANPMYMRPLRPGGRGELGGQLVEASFRVYMVNTQGQCSPGCTFAMSQDSVCQAACDNDLCDFDNGVCIDWPPLPNPFDEVGNFVALRRLAFNDPLTHSVMVFKEPLTSVDRPFLAMSEYNIMVTAITEAGESRPATLVATTGLPSRPGPAHFWQHPTTLQGGMLVMHWAPPDDRGGVPITGYMLYKDPDGSGAGLIRPDCLLYNGTLDTVNTSYIRRIELGKNYVFRIVAINEVGPAPFVLSQGLLRVNNRLPGPPFPPPAPKLSRTPTGGQVTVSFTDTVGDGGAPLTSYQVYARLRGATNWTRVHQYQTLQYDLPPPLPASATEAQNATGNATVVGEGCIAGEQPLQVPDSAPLGEVAIASLNGLPLTANTAYEFVATASNNPGSRDPTFCDANRRLCSLTGESPYSGIRSASTSAPTSPGPPSPPVVLAVTGGAITLQWEDPPDRGGVPLSGYSVQYKEVSAEAYNEVPLLLGLRQFMVVGLLEKRFYHLRIAAANGFSPLQYSEPLTKETKDATPPGKPSQPRPKDWTSESVDLEWDEPGDKGGVAAATLRYSVYLHKFEFPECGDFPPPGKDCALLSGSPGFCCDGDRFVEQSAGIAATAISISQLNPSTAYSFRIGASHTQFNSDPSDPLLFITPAQSEVPDAPRVGCYSARRVELRWKHIGSRPNVVFVASMLYIHYADTSNNQYDGPFRVKWGTFNYIARVRENRRYRFHVRLVRRTLNMAPGDEDIIDPPSASTYVTTPVNTAAPSYCPGRLGTAHVFAPGNNRRYVWNVQPNWEALKVFRGKPWRIRMTFTSFKLECDYDRVSILDSWGVEIWSGGCYRGKFTLLGRVRSNITVIYTTDTSFAEQGLTMEYNAEQTTAADTLVYDPPAPPLAACPGKGLPCGGPMRGECNVKSQCACRLGYLGEDCSGYHFCNMEGRAPEHRVCGELHNLRVVAVDGHDYEAASATKQRAGVWGVGTQARYGTRSKAYKTIGKALTDPPPRDDREVVLVVYPGVYADPKDTQILVKRGGTILVPPPMVRLEGLRAPSEQTLDCTGNGFGFEVSNGGRLSLHSIGLTRCTAPKGGALSVSGGSAYLINCKLFQNSATGSDISAEGGGGVFVAHGVVNITGGELSGNTAATAGGGLFALEAQVLMAGGRFHANSAPQGGGVYMIGSAFHAREGSALVSNSATLHGGGLELAPSGGINVSGLTIQGCVAPKGAGLYVSHPPINNPNDILAYSPSTVSLSALRNNVASTSGGGLYVVPHAKLHLNDTQLVGNTAPIGAGAFLSHGSSLLGNVASLGAAGSLGNLAGVLFKDNQATIAGGGIYAQGAAVDSLPCLVQHALLAGNSAPQGGGVQVMGGLTRLTHIVASACHATVGGGIHASNAARLELRYTLVANCTAHRGAGAAVELGSAVHGSFRSATFEANHANVSGGGVAILSAGSLFGLNMHDNSANRGGGLHVDLPLTAPSLLSSAVHDCHIWGNRALQSAAGVLVNSWDAGAGMTATASALLSTCSIWNNIAATAGGGLQVAREGDPAPSLDPAPGDALQTTASPNMYLNVTVIDSSFWGNEAQSGGGFHVSRSHLNMERVAVRGNSAAYGGGAYAEDSVVNFTHVLLSSNMAAVGGHNATQAGDGGNAYLHRSNQWFGGILEAGSSIRGGCMLCAPGSRSSLTLLKCVGNNASSLGGGLAAGIGARVTLRKSLFRSNSAPLGGAVALKERARAYVVGSHLIRNLASDAGGALYALPASYLDFHQSDAAENGLSDEGAPVAIGGGLHLTGTHAVLRHSAIRGNIAGAAGGLWAGGRSVLRVTTSDIANNTATALHGGGMLLEGASQLSLFQSMVSQNQANHPDFGDGGGVYLDSSSAANFTVSSLLRNRAAHDAGGLFARGSYASLVRSSILKNKAGHAGGGIGASRSRIQMVECDILFNKAAVLGGGLHSISRVHSFVRDSSVVSNVAGVDGGGFSLADRSSLHTDHVILQLNSATAGSGGALLLRAGSSANLTARTKLIQNEAALGGGGCDCSTSSLVATNVELKHNRALNGGAIAADASSLSITSCLLERNGARGSGGSVLLQNDASAEIRKSTIQHNYAAVKGGVAQVAAASVLTLHTCTITNNSAASGAVLGIIGGGSGAIESCTLYRNLAATQGGIATVEGKSSIAAAPVGGTLGGSSTNFTTSTPITTKRPSHFNLRTSTLYLNDGGQRAGGVCVLNFATAFVELSQIFSSTAQQGGFAFVSASASLTVQSSKFHANHARSEAGVAYVSERSHAQFSDSVFTGCSARTNGGISFVSEYSSLHLISSHVFGKLDPTVDARVVRSAPTVHAAQGGALYVTAHSVTVCRDVTARNLSVSAGGGFSFTEKSSTSHFRHFKAHHNDAELGAAISAVQAATITMLHCECADNYVLYDGGAIMLDSGSHAHLLDVSLLRNFAIENGGGLFVGTNCNVTVTDSLIESNNAQVGAGSFLARLSDLTFKGTLFTHNTALDSGGGAHSGSRTNMTLIHCTFSRNVALWMGGAVHADGWTIVRLQRTRLVSNVATAYGGGVAVRGNATVIISDSALLSHNSAGVGGGGIAIISYANLTFNESTLEHSLSNNEGGGLWLSNHGSLFSYGSIFQHNLAMVGNGGGSFMAGESFAILNKCQFLNNKAVLGRGGGLYSTHSHRPTDLPVNRRTRSLFMDNLAFHRNSAVAGGGFFWEIAYDRLLKPLLQLRVTCINCEYSSNSVYDHSTRAVTTQLVNFPVQKVRSGVIIRGGLNETLTVHILSRDIYGQVDHMDNSSICLLSEMTLSRAEIAARAGAKAAARDTKAAIVNPKGEAVMGVTLYDFSSLKAEIGSFHLLQFQCVDFEQHYFPVLNQSTIIGPCLPGEELTQDQICRRCPANTYSVRGEVCRPCPRGGVCSKGTHIENQVVGVAVPFAKPGFWRDQAQSSLASADICAPFYDERCRAHQYWDFEFDTCMKLDPEVGWTAEVQFGCDAAQQFYMCEMDDNACHGDPNPPHVHAYEDQCNEGYRGVMCSGCKLFFYQTPANTCAHCQGGNDPRVAKMIYGTGFAIGGCVLVCIVVLYLQEDHTAIENFILMFICCCWADKLRGEKAKRELQVIEAYEEHERLRKHLPIGYREHGLEDSATPPNVWLRAEKPKILLINMQIFSQFKTANVIEWPQMVHDYIGSFTSFSFDLLKLTAFECMYKTDFFFSFFFVAAFPFGSLIVLSFIHFAGRKLYTKKLAAKPKVCQRCGISINTLLPIGHRVEPLLTAGEEAALKQLGDAAQEASGVLYPEAQSATDKATESVPTDNNNKADKTKPFKFSIGGNRTATKTARPHFLPYLTLPSSPVFHSDCSLADLTPEQRSSLVKGNLALFRIRCMIRLRHRNFENKTLKMFFWLLLMSYTPISSKLLRLFKCTEVGAQRYLTSDFTVVCDIGGQWGLYLLFAGVPAFVVFILGIPSLFFGVLYTCRQHNVEEIIATVQGIGRTGRRNLLKVKLLAEARTEMEARGEMWTQPHSEEDEFRRLRRYLRVKNLRLHSNRARLGFIYQFYQERTWWYEIVELSRKFTVNCMLFFFAPGSVLQVICTMFVCIIYMAIHSEANPYRTTTDTRLATFSHMQLSLTLFCGLLVKVNVPWLSRTPRYKEDQEMILSWIIIVVHASMLSYGVLTFVQDRFLILGAWKKKQAARRRHVRVLARINHCSDRSREVMRAIKLQKMAAGSDSGVGLNAVQILNSLQAVNAGDHIARKRWGHAIGVVNDVARVNHVVKEPTAEEGMTDLEASFMTTVHVYEMKLSMLAAESATLEQALATCTGTRPRSTFSPFVLISDEVRKMEINAQLQVLRTDGDRLFEELDQFTQEFESKEQEMRDKVRQEQADVDRIANKLL